MAWRELGTVFERGVNQIEVRRVRQSVVSVGQYTREVRDRIVQRIRGPLRDRVTVEGRLLMADFDEARRRCRIHPPYGLPVPCIFGDEQREAILELLTKYVRVVGQGERDEEPDRVRLVKIVDIEPVEIPGDREDFAFWEHPSVDRLAERQGVRAIERMQTLSTNFWDSDSELEEFLTDTYRSREAGLP
jgi:hypothetical protein